jgi:hypothetical protein
MGGGGVHGTHQRATGVEQALHRATERGGCEFHLPHLIDHHHAAGLGSRSAGSGVPSSVMIRLRVVAGEDAAMSWGGQALEVETKLGR